jgi:hypothetical protein
MPRLLFSARPEKTTLYTVHKGKVYKGEIKLNWFESTVASNDMITKQFEQLGFTKVKTTGSGQTRFVQGIWEHEDETVPLTDEHIVSVAEIS